MHALHAAQGACRAGTSRGYSQLDSAHTLNGKHVARMQMLLPFFHNRLRLWNDLSGSYEILLYKILVNQPSGFTHGCGAGLMLLT